MVSSSCAGLFLAVLVVATLGAPLRQSERHPLLMDVQDLDPNTFDLHAVNIVKEADQNTHEFIAMLEQAEDDSLNMEHLTAAFLELPPAHLVLGDVDDGGPEALWALKKQQNKAIPAELGAREVEDTTSLLGQDAAVLGDPNPQGSAFSSSIDEHFSDKTANLGELTKSVDDMKYRLDQLQRYIKRRLKCRLDPDSCTDALPLREKKPAEECTHKYKYLCRTTYELTPGASSSSGTGGGPVQAAQLLQQLSTTSVDSSAQKAQQQVIPQSNPKNMSPTTLLKLLEKQEHQIAEQSRLLKKATAKVQQLEGSKGVRKHGSMAETGASHPTVTVALETQASDPQATTNSVETVAVAPAEVAPKVAAEEQEKVAADTPVAVAEQELPAVVQNEPAVEPEQPVATAQEQQLEQEPAAVEQQVQATTEEKQPAEAKAQVSRDDLETVETIQMQAKRHDEAVQRARAKQHRNRPTAQDTHSKAEMWVNKVKAAKAGHPSSVFIPSHMRDVAVMTQLDEGLGDGADPTFPAFPSSDRIRQLAASAYDEQHKLGVLPAESLVELDEGVGGEEADSPAVGAMPDGEYVRRLAEITQEKSQGEATAQPLEMTEKLLAIPRTCVRWEGKVCDRFNDATHCLAMDAEHSLCGFVLPNQPPSTKEADLKRHFALVESSRL